MFAMNVNDLAERQVDMESIRDWSGEIANSYLRGGVEPTETLKKIAQAEELTPHQVEVLACEANKTIHQAKYASVEEKYHAADFPLADAKMALQGIQIDGGCEKVAVVMPRPKFEDKGPDAYAMFGVKPEVMDKTASVKHQVKTAYAHSELLLQKLNDKVMWLHNEKMAAERSFIKEARQCLLEESSSDARLKVLGEFDNFVKCAEMSNIGQPILAKVCLVMAKEGKLEPARAKECVNYFMSKEADNKAPASLISDNLQARIINGQHPLYITLKTIGDKEADFLRFQDQRNEVQSKVRILGQKIRAL